MGGDSFTFHQDHRDLIMTECHDTRYAGHLGVKKTLELIQRDFYWPTVQADVTAYVQTCEECQRNPQTRGQLDCYSH